MRSSFTQLYSFPSSIITTEWPKILVSVLLAPCWVSMETKESSKWLIATPFLLKRTWRSQMSGSSTTFITKRCSTWWDASMVERRSSDGIQQALNQRRMTFRSTKFCAATTRCPYMLSAVYKKQRRLVYQRLPTSHRKRLIRTETCAGSLSTSLLQSAQRRKKKSALNIFWEISRTLPRAHSLNKSVTRHKA